MAVLKVAAVFTDHLVLQRDKEIVVWGTVYGRENREIFVEIGTNKVMAILQGNRFEAVLPKMEAGGPYCLTVSTEGETHTFHDVMIGEVWLAGGQSNMELELRNSKDGEKAVEAMKDSRIRFYQVNRKSFIDDAFLKEEEKNSWQVAADGDCGTWSAVATYFAKEVAQMLNVTVGIIGCNWGGTSASAWVSEEDLKGDEQLETYLQEVKEAMGDKTLEEYEKKREEYFAWYEVWQKKIDGLYEERPDILWSEALEIAGESLWPEPLGPKSPYRPGGLYETMLRRVCPYTLRGFLYYQGESDDHKPESYEKLLTALIGRWRKDWREDSLPFLFVELPMYLGKQDVDRGNWAKIRLVQQAVFEKVKDTALTCILECGEFDNIHPVDKEVVGKRLAMQAFYHVYNVEPAKEKVDGPRYLSHRVEGNKMVVEFTNVGDRLIYKADRQYANSRKFYVPVEKPFAVISENGFEIAGNDGVFVPANIEVNKTSVTLSSALVKQPVAVRYAFHNYSPVTIYNSNQLPLSTFSTK